MTGLRLIALVAALGGLALLAGCSGSFAPTLPTPPAGGGTSVTVHGVTGALPTTLNGSNFSVKLNGTPTTVTGATKVGGARPLVITFLIDTTGSMGSTIENVKSTVSAFADTLSGHSVTWAAVEWGDDVRSNVPPTGDLNAIKTWLNGLGASGGGDTPENPIDALMAARLPASDPSGIGLGWTYPADADRYFIIFTDAPGHVPGDGGDAVVHFTPEQLLAAYNGWGVVDADTRDLSSAGSAASAAVRLNNGTMSSSVKPAVETSFDPREIADGYSFGTKLNNGTGGIWIDLFGPDGSDLTKFGIKEQVEGGYIVSFVVPHGMTSADVAITATWSGGTASWDYPGFVF